MEIIIDGEAFYLERGSYMNDRVALFLSDDEGQPYCDVTVNIPEHRLLPDEIIVDVHKGCSGMVAALWEARVLGERVGTARSGFNDYPVHKLLIY